MARSLRGLFLGRLLPAMLVLVLVSALAAYLMARRAATLGYDHSLLDVTLALAGQIYTKNHTIVLDLAPQAQEMLLTDRYDLEFYEVIGPDGISVAGYHGLPRPTKALAEGGIEYFDGRYQGQPVRVAALRTRRDGRAILVLAAETMVKRNTLVREILLDMLLPELAIVVAVLALGWLFIRLGLKPLEGLRAELARRDRAHLGPVTARGLPDEMRPVAEEINHLLDRLKQTLSAQRHFVSDAAHQLRTPIAALQAQAEAAEWELADNAASAPARAQFKRILAATRRLSHLAQQLLALARAEPGNSTLLTPLDLANLVRTEAENWLPAANAKYIDLGFEIAAAPLRGAPRLLKEMLANLVDNAIRYTPSGGTVTVRCGMRAGSAFLEVEDNGPGIPPTERERVFERFRRLPSADDEGCGLGLAIVREICGQHGATASVVEATTLGGACFSVKFPAMNTGR
ncbi:MAG TPA: sensor histidine kinase [Sulfuricella sp.]|nr:sensor histidine kinase [Sulfuricella sp.]